MKDKLTALGIYLTIATILVIIPLGFVAMFISGILGLTNIIKDLRLFESIFFTVLPVILLPPYMTITFLSLGL